MKPTQQSIGILAGSGQFPFLVARKAKKSGLRISICGFHGNTDPALANEADAFVLLHLGQLGGLIDFFKKQGINQVCMAGAINKPGALNIKPDMRAAKLLFRLAGCKGDDALLRAVAEELRSEGIEVVSPDILVPALHTLPGILGAVHPNAEIWRDIRFGWQIAKTVGGLDIGQTVVVRSGIVVAVEGIEGTNEALSRGGKLGGAGCIAIKTAKPGQDKRLDMPSLGAETLTVLARHHYSCLAFEAGNSLFFDQDMALETANQHGIALVAVPDNPEDFFRQHCT